MRGMKHLKDCISCSRCGNQVDTLAKRRHRCKKESIVEHKKFNHTLFEFKEASCVMCQRPIHTWKAEILCSKDCEMDYWNYLHGSGCKPVIRLI